MNGTATATETKLLTGVIDPAHSRVQFKVKHLMISNVLGSFKEFEGKGLIQKDEDNYELKGILTIKGISKPVTLAIEFGGFMTDPWGNKKAGFSVTGEINRKEWGMGWNATLEAGGVLVGEKIKLNCDVEFGIS